MIAAGVPVGMVCLRAVSRLRLPDKTVQVWVLHDALVEPVCAALGHTLSQDERQRVRAFKQDRQRNRFIARRAILRWLTGRYLSCKSESLRFSATPLGKPLLQWPIAPRLAFSVSQTDAMALLAFAWGCRLGVDVEQWLDSVDAAGVGQDIFFSDEKKTVDAGQADSAAAFFRIWTRKEALLKALGTGLSGHPKTYTTEGDGENGASRWRASHCDVPIAGWTFLDFFLGRNVSGKVSGALTVSLPEAQVSLRVLA